MPSSPAARFLRPIKIHPSQILSLGARTATLAATVFALSGCQTYTEKNNDRDQSIRSGNIAAAVARSEKDVAKNKDNKDSVLYLLEHGAILRAAALANLPAPGTPAAATRLEGQSQTAEALNAAPPEAVSPRIGYLTRSVATFDEAARRIDDYESAAKIRVGAEAGALLTNQANLPYRGRAYDKVMLHTYQALNYLQLRDPDAARVELNRALQRQRDAVAANAKRIREAQDLAKEAETGGVQDEQGRQGSAYDVERAKSDPRTSAGLAGIESKFNAAILPYGDYVNPFTTFLDALAFTHQGADASDLERARKSWERVVNFAKDNPYAQADYIEVEPDIQPAPAPLAAPAGTVDSPAVPQVSGLTAQPSLSSGSPPSSAGLTYVIFETGTAPYRDQVRIDIPIFIVTDSLSYVGAAFPRIEPVGGYASQLQVTTSTGAAYPTALVASMDSVIAQDFKNEWPGILTKTLISTATKATIDAVLQKQIQDQAGTTGAMFFKLATAITQAAINIADTRTWRTLPKEFQYARLPTPEDRVLTLSASGLATTISVEPAAVTVVYVRSAGLYSPLLVSQFILKK